MLAYFDAFYYIMSTHLFNMHLYEDIYMTGKPK
jgi:hypothetical protein